MENFSVTAFLSLKGWMRGEKKMSSLPPYLSVPLRAYPYFLLTGKTLVTERNCILIQFS